MENSLNEMRLNPTVLVNLYGSALYHIPNQQQPVLQAQPETSYVKFLGGNAAGVLILVNDPKNTFLGEEEMSLLIKMLEACKLNTGDVAIVNLASGAHTVDLIIEEMRPEKIILFGARDTSAQPLYEPGTLSGIPLLAANALSDMLPKTEDARVAKQRLWAALKTMFGIN